MPPDPPTLILRIRVQVLVQAGAMQFFLCQDCILVGVQVNATILFMITYMHDHIFRGDPREVLINFQPLHGHAHAFTHSCPTFKSLLMALR